MVSCNKCGTELTTNESVSNNENVSNNVGGNNNEVSNQTVAPITLIKGIVKANNQGVK